ncbi:hypothetical protein HL658_24050 [Azospirillum sp. RWY-5-1]|uniref:Glycosyltransferase n=1 Tax=Azospirillum oleiclasticum TaxID=2735135 RepID=A0ABX2TEG8_9PROT|nr:hypothetical protein [Azospirillum oleiclasticum]NYZ15625.1 hypothetical protein [Azospirillum oleiclasticum]NYZ22648.1 hypothetical protein [Azospirillum oleiclasticum]
MSDSSPSRISDFLNGVTGDRGRGREAWRRWADSIGPLTADLPVPVTGAMLAVWMTRPDLQARFPLDRPSDRLGFALWCLLEGRRDYPSLRGMVDPAVLAVLTEPAKAIPVDQYGPVVSEIMLHLHATRPDLRASYDLSKPPGRAYLLAWFLIHQRAGSDFTDFLPDWQRTLLTKPFSIPGLDWGGRPFNWLMVLVHSIITDLRARFDLTKAPGQDGFLRWFVMTGVAELKLLDLVDDRLLAWLGQPADAGEPPLPRLAVWVRDSDGAIGKRFPAGSAEERKTYLDWLRRDGADSHPLLPRVLPTEAPKTAAVERVSRPPVVAAPGIDLVGCTGTERGLDELRYAARALESARVPFRILHTDPADSAALHDAGLSAFLAPSAANGVTLLCATGAEALQALARFGRQPFEGRRRVIGCWSWELPEWPEEWRFALDLVDEIWAPNRYAQAALELVSPVPVVCMPEAVSVAARRRRPRADLGLPEGDALFAAIYDGATLARQNPLAAVQAFSRAFPHGTEPVGLVVRAVNTAAEQPEWQVLRAAVDADPRIRIVADVMTRSAVLGLIDACDAFVSLHRAESSARAVAEAMMLGKPVVVTGFSATMDLTNPGTACVVPWRRVPVDPGYLGGAGQSWADPDIDVAAAHMAALAGDPAEARRLGRAGRSHAESLHAPALVGARFRRRLDALGLLTPACDDPA